MTFSNYVNLHLVEASYNKEALKKLENGILGLNPKDFIKKAKINAKEGSYRFRRPNFVKYEKYLGITKTYTKGSEYDLLRNISLKDVSSKVQKHIIEATPFKKDNLKYHKQYNITILNEDNLIDIELKTKDIPKDMCNDFGTPKKHLIQKNFSKGFKLSINNKTFNISKYKDSIYNNYIPEETIINDIFEYFNDIDEEKRNNKELQEILFLTLTDEVIKNVFLEKPKDIEVKIEDELKKAKSPKTFREVLKKYSFQNTPSEDIIKGLMKSDKFKYFTEPKDDGFGHKQGLEYNINIRKRTITLDAYSTSD